MTADMHAVSANGNATNRWHTWNAIHRRGDVLEAGDLRIEISALGDIRDIRVGDLQISQYRPSMYDAGISGLWLRRHRADGVESTPLIGAHSHSRVTVGEHDAVWRGSALGVDWEVTLSPSACEPVWMWRVTIVPRRGGEDISADSWDIVSAQDLALAPSDQAMSSEPYISQYITYRTADMPGTGRVLAARQTMACAPRLPLLVTAILEGARAHLTDGFDFYGLRARSGESPAALVDATWSGGSTHQYEFGMACLLSNERTFDAADNAADNAAVQSKGRLTWTLMHAFVPDFDGDMVAQCAKQVDRMRDQARNLTAPSAHNHGDAPDAEGAEPPASGVPSLLATARALNGDQLSDEEFLSLGRGSVQYREADHQGRLLSYFSTNAAHIVAQAKELCVDRSHGQILLTGNESKPGVAVMAATTYASGVFASHVVLGNTNMNRLVSVQRTSLNLLRSQGIRILVRFEGQWRLLSVPSAYVMNIGGSQWVYRLGQRTITVTTLASPSDCAVQITMTSTTPIDAVMTIDIENPTQWRASDAFESGEGPSNAPDGVLLTPDPNDTIANHYPGLAYVFAAKGAKFGGDSALFVAPDAPGMPDVPDESASPHEHCIQTPAYGSRVITCKARSTTSLRVVAAASLETPDEAAALAAELLEHRLDEGAVVRKHYEFVSAYMNHLNVDAAGRLGELSVLAPWLVQNALVHLLSPHGLEQYSGAAWGTRDVCQGPLEMALGFGHFDDVRTIILTVLAHQNPDGSLPQWFMFDRYSEMYQHDSHGDIPLWPLMAISEYLEATGDYALLGEPVAFWDGARNEPVAESGDHPTVADHMERTLDYIRGHRVPGTELFSYGEGDWDDTLQPARESMKQEMASTWTIALLFQISRSLQALLAHGGAYQGLSAQFGAEANTIERHFAGDFIFEGVLAGYVVFSHAGKRPIIHPSDNRTGLHYRLIPMTRSIIAGLLPDESASRHERIIAGNLHYPDGVRLMDRPAPYHDGVITYFRRAEQSANIGREIGLMYTHAHVRYVEALSQLGRDTVGDELLRISPVNQFRRLPSSEMRQRNCYFASSDADFPDRYTAAAQWDRLEQASPDPVGVRGGWRVYSSGPGIYLRQMVQHLFGVQLHRDGLVIDPVMSVDDDGTSLTIDLFGVRRTIRYHVVAGDVPVSVKAGDRELDGTRLSLRYRDGGLSLSRRQLTDITTLDVTVGADRSHIRPTKTND